jgi:hypothetical protein
MKPHAHPDDRPELAQEIYERLFLVGRVSFKTGLAKRII